MHPELRAEQAHVDRAYDRLAELDRLALAFAEAERRGDDRTPAAMLERDVRERTGLRRRATLRLGALNLCFGRIDGLDGESFHLGRVAVADEAHEPLVVDWRAPIAEPFYRATPAAPLGIRRRRHLITKGRQVLRLDDELLALGDPTEGVDGSGAGDDLVLVGEAALLDAVRRSRTGRMGDIVATIQSEQDRIIRAPLGGLVVVQGGPGTGKTAVALHRAAYLLYTHRFPLEHLGVLFIGPNPVFLRYIERVLPTLGESGCRMATVDELIESSGRSSTHDAAAVARLKGDVRMAALLANAVRSRQRPLRKVATIPVGAYSLSFGPKRSAAVVEQVVAMSGTHNARRPVVEELVLRHLRRQYARAVARAQAAGRSARALASDDLDDALRSSRELRGVLDRIWPVLTPEQLLDDLLGAPALLAEAAGGLLSAEEQAALVRRRAPAGEDPTWSSSDVPLLDEAYPLLGPSTRRGSRPLARSGRTSGEDVTAIVDRALADALPECPECESELTFTGATSADWLCGACGREWRSEQVLSPAAAVQLRTLRVRLAAAAAEPVETVDAGLRTYGHVVVDEAQDLSPMQWRMLARRCPSGSMTVVGDLAQASGHWAPASWQEVADLLDAPRTSVVELTVNYRTPSEVMALAASVLAEARPDLTPAASVRDAGVTPRRVEVGDPSVLVATAVEVAAEEAAAVGDGKVAVICPSALVRTVAARLATGDLGAHDDDVLAAPISAFGLDDVKGLEFDAVVVVEPAVIADEHAHGLGALYVALTRTTTRLALVHAGPLPASLVARERRGRTSPSGASSATSGP